MCVSLELHSAPSLWMFLSIQESSGSSHKENTATVLLTHISWTNIELEKLKFN